MQDTLFGDWSREGMDALELPEWIEKMRDAESTIIRIAQEHQLEKDPQHMARTPSEDTITDYPVDSFVLVAYPDEGMRKGPPSKVMTHLRGPMRIVGQRDDTYTVRDLTTNRVTDVHVSRLRPFQYDPNHTNPKKSLLPTSRRSS